MTFFKWFLLIILTLFWLNPAFAELSEDEISELQTRLMVAGYYHKKIDGIKGEETIKASVGYLGLDIDNKTTLKLALNKLREEQKIDQMVAKQIEKQRLASLEKKMEEMIAINNNFVNKYNNEISKLESSPVLHEKIKDKILSDFTIPLIFCFFGAVIFVVSGYLYAKRMIESQVLIKVNESKLEIDEHAEKVSSKGKATIYELNAFLFWKLTRLLKPENYNGISYLYNDLVEIQLIASQYSEMAGKLLSDEKLYEKLSVLSNSAYFYVDQSVDTEYYERAKKIYPQIKGLVLKIPRSEYSHYRKMIESTLYVAYITKQEKLDDIKAGLEKLFTGADPKWEQETKLKYPNISFNN